MPTDATTEIMMQFIDTDKQAITAECPIAILDTDELANKDVPGFAKGFTSGRYFLVDSFHFSLEVSGQESGSRQSSGAPAAVTPLTSTGRPDPRVLASLAAIQRRAPPLAKGRPGIPAAPGLGGLSAADLKKLFPTQLADNSDEFAPLAQRQDGGSE